MVECLVTAWMVDVADPRGDQSLCLTWVVVGSGLQANS